MKNAHIKSKAAPGGQQGVQTFVRRFAACCLIGVAAMSAAQAGPRDRERERDHDGQSQREAPRNERAQRQPERRADERQQRQYDTRAYEGRYEDPRRNGQVQEQQNAQSNAERRSGRLTPDERRDLRRQINEAGADIYPSRQRR